MFALIRYTKIFPLQICDNPEPNTFTQIVTNPHMCIEVWGKVISERLRILEVWALRQGLELAADCHLAKINQAAKFLQVN